MDSDYLSDNAILEELDEDALKALEDEAIRYATQSNTERTRNAPNQPILTNNKELLTLTTLPSRSTSRPQVQAPSSDYGALDDAVELWEAAGPTLPAQGTGAEDTEYVQVEHADRPGNIALNYGAAQSHQYNDEQDMEMYDQPDHGGMQGQRYDGQEYYAHPVEDSEKEELRRALAELEKEREALLRDVRAAKDAAMAKAGEISIVRGNAERTAKEHERALQSLTLQQQEEQERHRKELEAMRAEVERLKTDNAFLKLDMEEAVKRTKEKPRVVVPEATKRQGSIMVDIRKPKGSLASPSTPKKNRGLNFCDGFNDVEMLSPSKLGRAGSRTPSSRPTSKRKRSAQDSPAFELPITHSPRRPVFPLESQAVVAFNFKVYDKLYDEEENLEFYEYFIARRTKFSGAPTLESLAKFSIPIDKGRTLSDRFLEGMNFAKAEAGEPSLIGNVCKSLFSIWKVFLEEDYWIPFKLIVELLHCALGWAKANIVRQFMDQAEQIIQETVDIDALARNGKDKRPRPHEGMEVQDALKILYMIGNIVHHNEEYKLRFWKNIRTDFPYVLLNLYQDLYAMRQMLQILRLSIWPATFGPRLSGQADQRKYETFLVNLLSKLLVNDPVLLPERLHWPRTEIIKMRVDIVHLLGAMTQSSYAVDVLADHPLFIARLVSRISDEVDEMYRFRAGVRDSVAFINGAVRILHGLINLRPTELADKLGKIQGANHKYMSAMTRIAFSEGLVQEAGIDPGVVDRAYSLVEMAVTPEEGDALDALFRRRDADAVM